MGPAPSPSTAPPSSPSAMTSVTVAPHGVAQQQRAERPGHRYSIRSQPRADPLDVWAGGPGGGPPFPGETVVAGRLTHLNRGRQQRPSGFGRISGSLVPGASLRPLSYVGRMGLGRVHRSVGVTGGLHVLDDILIGQSHGAAEIILPDDVTEPVAICFPRVTRLRAATFCAFLRFSDVGLGKETLEILAVDPAQCVDRTVLRRAVVLKVTQEGYTVAISLRP